VKIDLWHLNIFLYTKEKRWRKKKLINSLQITEKNFYKSVHTEENKDPRSHEVVMKTECPDCDSMATYLDRMSLHPLSVWKLDLDHKVTREKEIK